MSSKIKVDTIENVAGSGNVSLGSGHNLVVPGNITGQGTAAITSNATVGGTLGVTGVTTLGSTMSATKISAGTTDNPNSSPLYIRCATDDNIRIGQETHAAIGAVNNAANAFVDLKIDASQLSLCSQSTGQVTKPNQTYFHVGKNSSAGDHQLNISTTGYDNVTMDTEIIDRGANYNTSTSQFTAPVTGTYHLTLNIRLDNVDTASSYYNVVIATSNRHYQQLFNHPDSDIPIMAVSFTAIADMDASDIAYIRIFQNGGTSQTDINAYNTSFFGYLLG